MALILALLLTKRQGSLDQEWTSIIPTQRLRAELIFIDETERTNVRRAIQHRVDCGVARQCKYLVLS